VIDPGAEYRFRDGAATLIAEIDAALESGEIDETGWHARIAGIIRQAYLARRRRRRRSPDSRVARWPGSTRAA